MRHYLPVETKDLYYVDNSCKVLDVTQLVYGDNLPSNMGASKSEISDHLPVYAIFKVDERDRD